jgi:hypothetical protein
LPLTRNHRLKRAIILDNCPICLTTIKDSSQVCDCGFIFDLKDITDKDKTINHYNKLDWTKQIEITRRMQKIFRPQIKIAGLLGKRSKSQISMDLKLAKGFDKYPELRKCENRRQANLLLKKKDCGIAIQDKEDKSELEKYLQKYLEDNWDKISELDKWELKEKYFQIGQNCIIDLLAKHKDDPKWLVIELKVSQSSDSAMGQLLRYMGCVKKHKNEVVEGMIISQNSDPIGIEYVLEALEGNPVIRIMNYRFVGGQLKLYDYRSMLKEALDLFGQMSGEAQKKIFPS